MSTLQVANVHLESTGNNRIQYSGSNGYILYAGGVQGLSVNSTSFADSKGDIRDVPFNVQTTSYTLVSTDTGKMISTNSDITVPGSVFSNGQNVSIFNNSTANIAISNGASVTMYLVGTANTSARTLQQKGIATIVCVGANTFVISGGGLV